MVQKDIKSGNYEDRLQSIEMRLTNLESVLALNNLNQQGVKSVEFQTDGSSFPAEAIIDEEKGLESRIGRVGLAWLGNFVLLFAIVFFTEYIITLGHGL